MTNSIQSHAKIFTVLEALQQYDKHPPPQPKISPIGRVKTLNKKGSMSPNFDEATLAFIEYANGKTVLEIGGAYGNVMLETLAKFPDTTYHMNDIDERHLLIAAKHSSQANIPANTLNRVRLICADITQEFNTNTMYDAILAARVLHFMSPDELESTVINFRNKLKQYGCVYVVAITPYVYLFRNYIKKYEAMSAKNVKYPGYVQSLKQCLSDQMLSLPHIQELPDKHFMFLDENVLSRIFKEHGFNVLKTKIIPLPYSSKIWSLDNRENVILIAEKI